MNILETMQSRRSVRSYTGLPLDGETIGKIEKYISALEPPFGVNCRIELIRADIGGEPVKLGTYGSIRGATDFLALILEPGPLAEEGAAYMFEQVVLYCTSLGLGTCWLGGFLSGGNFRKRLDLQPGERLRIASPVGFADGGKRGGLMGLIGGSKPKPRKPFTENFFNGRFGDPLTAEEAGAYAVPLEMVRIAPSANNKQSWRVVMEDHALHFYRSASLGFDSLDLGIALCHFELACRELGIPGHYDLLGAAPQGHKATYVISWIVG